MARSKNVGKTIISGVESENVSKPITISKTNIKKNSDKNSDFKSIFSDFGMTFFKFTVRAVELILLILIIMFLCIIAGNTCIPLLAYQMSAGFGLDQSTNIYVAFASWMLPMFFYVLLSAAGMFLLLKYIVRKIHNRFTAIIEKFENKKKESK